MKIHRSLRLAVAVLMLGGAAGIASAQYGPGYGNAYREQAGPGDYATRMGFQDGMNDGGRDRATGHSFRPTQDSHYKHAPEYGHPDINRDAYKSLYRDAYVRGYEKGYGR
jgi:hypothetical protein